MPAAFELRPRRPRAFLELRLNLPPPCGGDGRAGRVNSPACCSI